MVWIDYRRTINTTSHSLLSWVFLWLGLDYSLVTCPKELILLGSPLHPVKTCSSNRGNVCQSEDEYSMVICLVFAVVAIATFWINEKYEWLLLWQPWLTKALTHSAILHGWYVNAIFNKAYGYPGALAYCRNAVGNGQMYIGTSQKKMMLGTCRGGLDRRRKHP